MNRRHIILKGQVIVQRSLSPTFPEQMADHQLRARLQYLLDVKLREMEQLLNALLEVEPLDLDALTLPKETL